MGEGRSTVSDRRLRGRLRTRSGGSDRRGPARLASGRKRFAGSEPAATRKGSALQGIALVCHMN